MWLTKYFNKKQNKENSLINHIKDNYDFDEVFLIKETDECFSLSINLLAASIIERNNSSMGVVTVDPVHIEKLVNQIKSEGDCLIIKFSRRYVMSTAYYYAVLLNNSEGYTIPSRYITDPRLFSTFPSLRGFDYKFIENLIKFKSYRYVKTNNHINIIPSYSIRFPVKPTGLLENFRDSYSLRNLQSTCSRDLEVIVDIETIDKIVNYSVKLFYGNLLLKEKNVLEIPDLEAFFDDFLFPYNMKYELINELGISLPLQFTPEFLKSMDDDFKLTVDMLKI
jgi:hypothetical protein